MFLDKNMLYQKPYFSKYKKIIFNKISIDRENMLKLN